MGIIQKILNKLFPITEDDLQRWREREMEVNEDLLRWNDRMVKADQRMLAREKKRREKKKLQHENNHCRLRL